MKFFQKCEPSEKQKSIIREYQILHVQWNESEPLPPPFITCLANTEQNLYFYPKDGVKVLPSADSEGFPAPFASITGPKNRPVGLKFGTDYLMIKVAFQPTGLYRLLRISMQKTVNIGMDANDFFPKEIPRINKQLKEASTYEDMIQIVSLFIEKKIEEGIAIEEPIDQISIEMLDPYSKRSIVEWADMACLSLRQFERNFAKRVGISPKMYIRIVRFENAMKLKSKSPDKSWTEIALECEYDDSSHLLKEFRQFADFAPGTLLGKQTSGHGDFPTG